MKCTSAFFSPVVFISSKNDYNCFCDANVVLKERKLREQKNELDKTSGCFFLSHFALLLLVFTWLVANMQILLLSRNIGEVHFTIEAARFFSKSGACRRKKIRMRFFWHQCNFVLVYGIHRNERKMHKCDRRLNLKPNKHYVRYEIV